MEKFMWSPVIIFAYNRLEHLQKCLDSLENVEGAKYSDMYIFADGYKGEHDREKVLAVQSFLEKYKEMSCFKRVYLTCEKQNRGLANSVIAGVSKIVEEYGRAIVVEDDLVVSPDFLVYMNAALEHYEKNPQIWQISGWSPSLLALDELSEDTFLWYRGSSWGWAIWSDRWKTVDWSVSDYKKFRFSLLKRYKMNRGGADMADMLDMQMQGRLDSWAIRFAYAESMSNRLTVFPKDSRVVNGGMDGTGTHCGFDKKHMADRMMASVMSHDIREGDFKWGERIPPTKISRWIYRYYSGSRWICLKNRIKSVMNRFNIKKY